MYYTLSRIFLLTVITLSLLCSCTFKKPSVKISQTKTDTDTAIINIQSVEFKNLSDESFEAKLNEDYQAIIDNTLEEFYKKTETTKPLLEKASFNLAQDVKYEGDNILSVVGEGYIFTDGVHPTGFRIAKNINTLNNKEIKLSNLFSDSEYEKAINREIENIIDENLEEYSDLWEKPILSSIHQEYFYLSKDGLVIFYPPYELSYYARGFVEFTIPYSKLSGYYSEDYKFLKNIC